MKKLDIKGIAAVGGLVVAVFTFVYNKIEAHYDRQESRAVQKESYEAIKDKVGELTARLDTLEKLLPTLFKEEKARMIQQKFISEQVDRSWKKAAEKIKENPGGVDFSSLSSITNEYPKEKENQLPDFKYVEMKAAKGE